MSCPRKHLHIIRSEPKLAEMQIDSEMGWYEQSTMWVEKRIILTRVKQHLFVVWQVGLCSDHNVFYIHSQFDALQLDTEHTLTRGVNEAFQMITK